MEPGIRLNDRNPLYISIRRSTQILDMCSVGRLVQLLFTDCTIIVTSRAVVSWLGSALRASGEYIWSTRR